MHKLQTMTIRFLVYLEVRSLLVPIYLEVRSYLGNLEVSTTHCESTMRKCVGTIDRSGLTIIPTQYSYSIALTSSCSQ